MSKPGGVDAEAILSLDRLVHEPARLLILTVLSGAEQVEFKFLQRMSGLTKGNLSGHSAKLERAGYVEVIKVFRAKIPVTSFRLTSQGRGALERYWQQIRHLQPEPRE